jgi:release factor glutamine methyltransferase
MRATTSCPKERKNREIFAERLAWGTDYLKKRGVPSPRHDAEQLLAFLLQRNRFDLYLSPPELSVHDHDSYQSLIFRRGEREPLQYLLGEVSFYGRAFTVDRHVLIPRQETELLIDEVLRRAGASQEIIEIGTGSGCIAVTLACEKPEAKILAVDVSTDALLLARGNADRHRVGHRIRWMVGNGLQAVRSVHAVDLLIANLPYVPESSRDLLQPEVRDFEPPVALFGGPDGLALIRDLIGNVRSVLRPGGLLALEIGAEQGKSVEALLGDVEGFERVEVLKDFAGLDRMVFARPIE